MTITPQWDADGVQHMLLDGVDVSTAIRSPQVSQSASVVASYAAVRDFLLDSQRRVAQSYAVIMDGRDIGTVVLPNADVKIYLTASAEVRAKRRWLELQQKQAPDTYEQVLSEMIERDRRDMNREVAPLRQAEDAVLIDSSDLSLEQSIQAVVQVISEAISS
jgi:cytidylate kinase